MSCRRYEEWLALEAGGDLPPEKAAELSSHMGECGNCRRAAEELRASLAALRAFHRSPVAEERLDAARATVLAELRTGGASSNWRRWITVQWLAPRWAAAGLAMALAVTIALWNSRSANQDQQENIVASKPALPSEASELPEEPEQPIPSPDEERDKERIVSVEQPAVPPALRPHHDKIEEQPIRAAAPVPEITEPAITVVSLPDSDSGDSEEKQDAVLQVASSDPDITIYWLVGRNGE
ncbi:MAG: hypothetical protein OXH92_17920 [Bryobacterales bacterium]|nr:hypothetical protein [Bryobacterales bacterium]